MSESHLVFNAPLVCSRRRDLYFKIRPPFISASLSPTCQGRHRSSWPLLFWVWLWVRGKDSHRRGEALSGVRVVPPVGSDRGHHVLASHARHVGTATHSHGNNQVAENAKGSAAMCSGQSFACFAREVRDTVLYRVFFFRRTPSPEQSRTTTRQGNRDVRERETTSLFAQTGRMGG